MRASIVEGRLGSRYRIDISGEYNPKAVEYILDGMDEFRLRADEYRNKFSFRRKKQKDSDYT